MLDYNEVKKFHAQKLADDITGGARVESAFFHTMKMVYLKGVEDGRRSTIEGEAHLPDPQRTQIGIVDTALDPCDVVRFPL